MQQWWIAIERSRRIQRRGAYRRPLSRPVRLTIAGAGVDGATADLSETGALVVLHAPPRTRIGDRVTIHLALAEERSLLVPARVVRTGRTGDGRPTLGLAFVELDAQRRDQLRRFVLAQQFRARAAGGVSPAGHE